MLVQVLFHEVVDGFSSAIERERCAILWLEPTKTMVQRSSILMVVFFCVTACSSSSSGGGGGGANVADKQNKDPDGAYGFDGVGWSQSENEDGSDVWNGPSGVAVHVMIDETVGYPSANAWAEAKHASAASSGVVMDFAVESLGNGTWWWGWYDEGNVFEGYLVSGSMGVNPQLQEHEAALSKDDAATIMKTFAIGE